MHSPRLVLLSHLALLAILACSGKTGQPSPSRQERIDSARADRPPNIILLLADDLGNGDLRAYHPESVIPTPNIDQLAAQGMRFTDAHSPSSACTPSRYGILTGRYAWRSRLKRKVLESFDPPLIEADRLTFPELLRRRGYATAAIGKWHLGMNVPATDRRGFVRMDGKLLPSNPDFTAAIQGGPLDRGFDTYFGAQLSSVRAFVRDRRYIGSPVPGPAGKRFVVPDWQETQKGPIQLAEALDLIKRFHADNRPFFLYYASQAPHTPYEPATEIAGIPVAETSGAGPRGDLVVELDVVLGQLVKRLNELEIADDTLIILASDNGAKVVGEDHGHDPAAGLRGKKGSAWEGGHRVPLIARWGDGTQVGSVIAPGSVNDQLIGLQDLMATVAALVGEPLPPASAEDSDSFLPVLLGQQNVAPMRTHLIHHSARGRFAIRRGDWKLILGRKSPLHRKDMHPAGPQLYNLTEDPHEAKDRYHDHPEIVDELTDLLRHDRRAGHSARRFK